eukprot:CAMPEP_0114031092 /NCGR_PEP_ID=MMETSP1159-20121227/4625_1 /TAXON_ID=88271 /ORGANISM="Picocystis salinarum" /LENGTH=37 /assembly_acc=CAM_ASM_000767
MAACECNTGVQKLSCPSDDSNKKMATKRRPGGKEMYL